MRARYRLREGNQIALDDSIDATLLCLHGIRESSQSVRKRPCEIWGSGARCQLRHEIDREDSVDSFEGRRGAREAKVPRSELVLQDTTVFAFGQDDRTNWGSNCN